MSQMSFLELYIHLELIIVQRIIFMKVLSFYFMYVSYWYFLFLCLFVLCLGSGADFFLFFVGWLFLVRILT